MGATVMLLAHFFRHKLLIFLLALCVTKSLQKCARNSSVEAATNVGKAQEKQFSAPLMR
jgi:hypothetical protein